MRTWSAKHVAFTRGGVRVIMQTRGDPPVTLSLRMASSWEPPTREDTECIYCTQNVQPEVHEHPRHAQNPPPSHRHRHRRAQVQGAQAHPPTKAYPSSQGLSEGRFRWWFPVNRPLVCRPRARAGPADADQPRSTEGGAWPRAVGSAPRASSVVFFLFFFELANTQGTPCALGCAFSE